MKNRTVVFQFDDDEARILTKIRLMLVGAAHLTPWAFSALGASCQQIKLGKGSPQKNFKMEHFPQEFDRFSETPSSQQEKWRACGWILLGSMRIPYLNHAVSKILHGRLAHATLCSRLGVRGIHSGTTLRAASALPEPQMT
jgi:hypothetical protein